MRARLSQSYRYVICATVPAARFAGASLFEWYAAAGDGSRALVAPPGGEGNPFTVIVV